MMRYNCGWKECRLLDLLQRFQRKGDGNHDANEIYSRRDGQSKI